MVGKIDSLSSEQKKRLLSRLKVAEGRTSKLQTINFDDLKGLPVFFECVSEARLIQTKHGEREVVDIRILQDIEPLKEGEEYSWFLVQTVVQSKIQAYKPLEGQRLCIIYLGKRRGQRYDYKDYWIGTEEEGRRLIEETLSEET